MLETLSELPKLIDTFVTGVIEFVYRYLHAVMKVALRPLSGPWQLRSDEARLSSRTVLFCSSAALAATFVVGIDHFNVLGEEASVGIMLLQIVLFYVIYDLLAALAALAGPADARDVSRSLVRYAFGTALALMTSWCLAVQVGNFIFFPQTAWLEPQKWQLSALLAALVAMTLVLFYAPAVTFIGMARRPAGGRLPTMVALLLAALGSLVAMAAMLAAPVVLGWIQVATGGRFETSSETCELDGMTFHVTAAIRNGRSEPLSISRNSLQLELSPVVDKDDLTTSFKRVATTLDFDKLDGGMVLVKPGESEIFKGDAGFDVDLRNLLRQNHYKLACRLAARKLPDRLFETTPRYTTFASRDDDDNSLPPSEPPMVPRYVPRYVPTPPAPARCPPATQPKALPNNVDQRPQG